MSIEIDQDSSPEQEQNRTLYTPLTEYSLYTHSHRVTLSTTDPRPQTSTSSSPRTAIAHGLRLRRVGQARALGELGLLGAGEAEVFFKQAAVV